MPLNVTFKVIVTGHFYIEIPDGRDDLYISGLLNFLAFKFFFFHFKNESRDYKKDRKERWSLRSGNVNAGLSHVLSENTIGILKQGTLSCAWNIYLQVNLAECPEGRQGKSGA